MCDKCVHQEVCKYSEHFERFCQVKIPATLIEVVKVEVACLKYKDERYYKVVRSMGSEG